MEFSLHYRGPLKSNGSVAHKHALRRHFHQQLKELWNQKPLKYFEEVFTNNDKYKWQTVIGEHRFLPIVAESRQLLANVDVTLLRPERPGSIITKAGDIDNRLKTLFDALRIPQNQNEIPAGEEPYPIDAPFLCVLEDDNLIQHVSIQTARLLESTTDPSEVVLLVRIEIKIIAATLENIAFGV